jgi:uncharacterized protein
MADENNTTQNKSDDDLDMALLDLLVCPVTHETLHYDRERQELISKGANLAFPIRDGIPILLAEEARPLSE